MGFYGRNRNINKPFLVSPLLGNRAAGIAAIDSCSKHSCQSLQMVAVVLPQAGLEDFISRFGTGEFVADFGHRLHSIWHLLNLSSDRERSLKLG
jgi:hypothetical protein